MSHGHCHDLLGSLSDYIDGAAGEQICSEIERHLAECENCRVVVDSLRKTVYLYQVIDETVNMPSAVRQRLFHCLDLDEFFQPDEK